MPPWRLQLTPGWREIRRSVWQKKGEGSLPRVQISPPKAFYWKHLGPDELTREALGTSKLAGREAVGDSAPLQAVGGVRLGPPLLSLFKVRFGFPATL